MSETIARLALTNTGIKTGFGLTTKSAESSAELLLNANFPVIDSHPFSMSVEGRKYAEKGQGAFMTVEPGISVKSDIPMPVPFFFLTGGIGYKAKLFGLGFEQKITADMSKNFEPKLQIAFTYDF
jgi:hypothetical protein